MNLTATNHRLCKSTDIEGVFLKCHSIDCEIFVNPPKEAKVSVDKVRKFITAA